MSVQCYRDEEEIKVPTVEFTDGKPWHEDE